MRWWVVALPIWGVLSAQLLAQAWTSWLGIPIYLAGLALGRGSRDRNGTQLAACVAQLVVFAVMLAVGDILVRTILHLGHSRIEQLVYWSIAIAAFLVFMVRGRHQVKQMWLVAMAERDAPEP